MNFTLEVLLQRERKFDYPQKEPAGFEISGKKKNK